MKNLHYRRQLDEFRQQVCLCLSASLCVSLSLNLSTMQLAAGRTDIRLPKYRRKAESRVKVCVRKRPLLEAQQVLSPKLTAGFSH